MQTAFLFPIRRFSAEAIQAIHARTMGKEGARTHCRALELILEETTPTNDEKTQAMGAELYGSPSRKEP